MREWLSQQAAAGFLAYREADGRYALPTEAAAVLAQEASPAFLAGGATLTGAVGSHRAGHQSGAGDLASAAPGG